MTLPELERAVESRERVMRAEMLRRAGLDYQLANLIGSSVARVYSPSASMPDFKQAYRFLLNEEAKEAFDEEQQRRADEASSIRFRQFANSFNNRFKEVAKE